jgi:hypothetical protein
MAKANSNSVSLAGEFALLSQLAVRGYDANMTLGHTKGVDILMSDPKTRRMRKLEVKTNYRGISRKPNVSKVHGRTLSSWIMHKKHETLSDPDLFYCFMNIGRQTNVFRCYVVPSAVVARYVRDQHSNWLRVRKRERKKVKKSNMRIFRIGLRSERYTVRTPTAERYENNWNFKK